MNNKTKLSIAILSAVILPLQLMAVDLGVAGSISAWQLSDSGTNSGIDDLRLIASESINNSTKIDFVADIQDGFSVKEGYLTFGKPLGVLKMNHDIEGLQVIAGQKLISFGVENTRYTEDRPFIGERPGVSELVGTGGLVGKGVEVAYKLPTSLPLQISAGYALDTISGSTGERETARTKTTSARIALSKESYSIGASTLMSEDGNDKNTLMGVDASFTHTLGTGGVNIEGEFVSASSDNDAVDSRTGFYAYAGYDWRNTWTTGVIFDSLSAADDTQDDYSAFGVVVTRELSKSAKLRAQYLSNNSDVDDSTISAQIVFNLK